MAESRPRLDLRRLLRYQPGPMRALITGSAGFIGFHLARRLLAEGHTVSGLDAFVPYYDVRLKEQRHALLRQSNHFREHRVDLADAAAVRAAVEESDPEVVLHLAAQAGVRYALEHPESYIQSNVVGTFNLLEACRGRPSGRGVRHFLLASTSSVYGAANRMPFLETDEVGTPLTIYAATKRSCELMAHSYAHLWGLPATAFRFFTVYGPWGRPDMALFKFTDAAFRGRPIELHNQGKMERDFTYVDDIVEGIVRLIPVVPQTATPAAEGDSVSPVAPFRIVNIGNGGPVPLMDLVTAVERSTGRTLERKLVPIAPGELVQTWADTSLLQALTGFRPGVPLAEGVERFVDWYRDHYRDEGHASPVDVGAAAR